MVVQYPARSFILKDVKESHYIVQIIAYSDQGIYSSPIESQINIRTSFEFDQANHRFHTRSLSRFHFDSCLQRFQSSADLAAQHPHSIVGCIRMRLLDLHIQVLLSPTIVLYGSRMQ